MEPCILTQQFCFSGFLPPDDARQPGPGVVLTMLQLRTARDDFISRYKSPGEDASDTVDVRASLVGDVEGEESV